MITSLHENFSVLDVGCGFRPKGYVNVDIHRNDNPETEFAEKGDVKKIPNFIQCDGQYMPFRDSIFEIAYSYHVIEHVQNPFLFLKEIVRVSKCEIIIRTPHKLCRKANPYHKQHFTKTWFAKALKKLGISNYEINYSNFSYYPHHFISLFKVPKEISIRILKQLPTSYLGTYDLGKGNFTRVEQ